MGRNGNASFLQSMGLLLVDASQEDRVTRGFSSALSLDSAQYMVASSAYHLKNGAT
jgi:hypothetical protein